VTLHEAMVEVLRSHGGGWMARDEIAREIARRDLFRRPSDGQPPERPASPPRSEARVPAPVRVQRHRLDTHPTAIEYSLGFD
jgi:hypothetical protein